MHEFLLSLHIVGAALWIGGGIVAVLARRSMIGRGPTATLEWMDLEGTLGKAFFPAAAVLTLLSGIGLVLVDDLYDFLDVFVVVGIAAFLLSAIGNSAYTARSDARALSAWREGDSRTATSLVANTTRFHIVDNTALILAIIAMVYRWGS